MTQLLWVRVLFNEDLSTNTHFLHRVLRSSNLILRWKPGVEMSSWSKVLRERAPSWNLLFGPVVNSPKYFELPCIVIAVDMVYIEYHSPRLIGSITLRHWRSFRKLQQVQRVRFGMIGRICPWILSSRARRERGILCFLMQFESSVIVCEGCSMLLW